MSSISDFNIETFLGSQSVDPINSVESIGGGTEESVRENWREPGYTGSIDYRFRQVSYSSILALHECPRKFQLSRVRAVRADESLDTSITFAFGHAIGEAIQLAFQAFSKEQIIWHLFLKWKPDLLAVDEKRSKSFWHVLFALDRFWSLREQGFLQEYELVRIDDVPAVELGFSINFPDGFRFRGFVDAVLRHKLTGAIIVLEVKTHGAFNLNPAIYKNSAQALGYSVVLDHLFPDLSSYQVLYLVYESKNREFTPIPFTKTYTQRARWIRELLLEVETLKRYAEEDLFPMHGQSCVSRFGYECEYFQVCTLSDEHLIKPCPPEAQDLTEYQVNISIQDLIETQLRKAEA